ncbi:MAG: protein kinase [Planctomycetes bacterium]|nr:protein kinase [Planctomycetota bacterium]
MQSNHPDGPARASSLEDLLTAALELQETGGMPELEAFLAAHPDQAAALREALTDLRTIDVLAPEAAAPPRQFGEFHLLGTLGAGGMGIVYLADQSSLGREVAVKVVRPELLFFDGARERFRREIDAVARLEHPAIVPILATGTADGVPYYVMPRIHGRSAETVMRALHGRDAGSLRGVDLRGVLPDAQSPDASDGTPVFGGAWWQAVVHLVHQAALGIAHAHSRGVLHRDLKPSNLMLTADGRAIVLDFGLAIARGDAQLTRSGTAAGSPAYMAPEQVRGEHADERTDVYGLAATLHCLLCLRPPFEAADGESLRNLILAGVRQTLAPAAAPVELRLVLDQALDVDPACRYPTAATFAADLLAVLDGRPIAARGVPAPVRLRRLARRHRVLATALAALAMFAVVLPTALLWQQRRANDLLAAQVQRSDHSARVSAETIETLLAALARERMLYTPGGQEAAAGMLRAALRHFDALADDPSQQERVQALRVRTMLRLAEVEKARGRFETAIDAARRAARLCGDSELAGEARLRRGEANRVLAGFLIDRGLVAEAPDLLARSRADLEPLIATPEWRARAQVNLAALREHGAMLASRAGDLATQEAMLREATRGYADAGERLCQTCTQAQLSSVLIARRQPAAALAIADQVLVDLALPGLREDGWPTPQFVDAMARMARGRALELLGRTDEADVEQQRALAGLDGFLQDFPNDPSARRARGITAHSLAQRCIEQRRWSEARTLLERACDDQGLALASVPDLPGARQDLGRHRRKLAQCLEALADFTALEPLARELGQMAADPLLPLCAAHCLMACAGHAPARAAALRAEALELWLESARRGRALDFDDPVFAPLHADPRVAALRRGQ